MTATYDLYGPIHKGLRLALADLQVRLGSTDFENPDAAAAVLDALSAQLELSELHLEDEERFIHPALEQRIAASTPALVEAHDHHRHSFDELRRLTEAVAAAAPGQKQAAGRLLYLRFSRFVADDFAHMHHEETVTLPLLQSAFSDDELAAIEQQIVGQLPPDKLTACMRLMLPAMSPPERLLTMAGIRQGAPAEVFSLIVEEAAKPGLAAEDWRALSAALELAA